MLREKEREKERERERCTACPNLYWDEHIANSKTSLRKWNWLRPKCIWQTFAWNMYHIYSLNFGVSWRSCFERQTTLWTICSRGAGIAQWIERRTRDRKVAGSNPCCSGGRIFYSRVNFLCWLLFRYPFHPHVTAAARKRPRSFCQKRRWQVTAKHAYTLRMWLCMKWHGAWLYGVHRTRRDWISLAADSCGTSHCKYTTSVDIQNRTTKTIHSCRITCERSESARERRIALYQSDS